MLALMRQDPARAPGSHRAARPRGRELPAAVRAELEVRRAGRGDLELRTECDLPAGGPRTALYRSASVGGAAYTADADPAAALYQCTSSALLHGIDRP